MRVVFLEDVPGVAQGGDVKEVRDGFARNYLLPKGLAVPATHNALQRVERLRQRARELRVKRLEETQALAQELDGRQVNVEMRAGSGGRLYGSVTATIVAQHLSQMTGREIDRRAVVIQEPIRQLGLFPVVVRLHPEVQAVVRVLVYPTGSDPEEFAQTLAEAEAPEQAEGEAGHDEQETPQDEGGQREGGA